jgi:hypothetical protein
MGDNLGVLVCYRLVSWNIQPVGSICDLFRLGSSWVVEMEDITAYENPTKSKEIG